VDAGAHGPRAGVSPSTLDYTSRGQE
jgi:hypothetical protein